MKKIFKLMPVALAAFALASCSSDDLFSDGAKQQKVKDGLTVNVETLMDEGSSVTRQGNVATGNGVVWEVGDLINVYDNKLAIYDEYAFDGGKFAGINDPDETRIASTQFALFPADRVDYAGWTAAEGAKAVMRIPQLIIYDEESEFQTSDKKDVYVSNLPMWGTATGTYPEAEVDMKFLTSVLKINILNAFANNITFLKVETQDATPISGAFEAILDAANPANAKLQKGASSLTNSNAIYVDLRNVPSYMTYIYLPIIAGHYDYMKVGVTSNLPTDAKPLERNADLIVSALETLDFTENAETGWLTIRNWEAGVDFAKSSVKPLSKETQYTLDKVNTCEMITKALEQYKNNPGDADGVLELNIGGTDGLLISRELDATDWTIKVPDMAASKVILNVPSGIINDVTNPVTLTVEDANSKAPYGGEVEFNAAKVTNNNLALSVELLDADFTLAGDFAAPKKLSPIEIKNVSTFTIGNGTDITGLAYDAELSIKSAEEVVVENKATVRTPLELVETKGLTDVTIKEGGLLNTYATLSVLNADVHVQGVITTDVFVYASAATTYIGENEADGSIANLYTIGKVQIENENESEAITGKISALGNNTINVKQGYVKLVTYDNTKGGFKPGTGLYDGKYVVKNLADLSKSDYQYKQVTVHFMENEGNTAFQTIDPTLLEYASGADYYNWIVFDNASTWNGEVIDAVNFSDYQLGKNLNNIYTACQLATQGTVDGQKALYNNIDLNNKQWTNPQLNRSFTGLDPRYKNAEGNKHAGRIEKVTTAGVDGKKGIHTIKNLKLQNTQDGIAKNKKKEFGLFGTISASSKDINVVNFILDQVTCDLAVVGTGSSAVVPSQIGAVAGLVDGSKNVTFKNIEVKNATIGGDANINPNTNTAVGIREASTFIGEVGKTVAMVDINGNKIAGSVIGQAFMGGVIGWDRNDATFVDGNTIATTFSVPTANVPSSYDFAIMDCGTVGNVVGQFAPNTKTTGTLKIGTNKANTITDGVTNKRALLGFKYNFLFESLTKYGFYGGNPAVGYSPEFTKDNLIVNTQKYDPEIKKVASKDAFDKLDAKFKQNAYIQWTPWAE